ncbi:LemA family protein [Mycobacteroides salmoniphilum]|uniref:LemA family protein n=1 Tax=Mycobacteroides salmoniphilum TaxID=404941 RepID=A0A4R8RVF0_9MYCO|nr:LemA family protein [Mycobacteroides salmoniphilum]TDZ76467.1 LemA family protein [Mycobacteroides salmoniphilum]TDZ78452.1 LemA family protein [Mycobacteroides salmoniphilum]TDZ84985.1 LemA family protein [Mycobacteroides salmoniphilum]
MTPLLIVIVVAVFFALIIGLWLLATYNGFVRIRNLVQESWKQIDVELQRRHDLIPNLIETASAAAQFERDTLQQVTAARNLARDAATTHQGVAAQAQAEQQLSGALGRFFAIAESYPQLQSIQNFVALQGELANTEDRIAAGRRFYNGNVRALNTKVQTVPSNIVAKWFGFTETEYFELDDPAARQVPNIRGAFDRLNPPPQQ